MKVKEISTQSFAEFARSNNDSQSVFNTEKWMNLFGDQLSCFGILDPQGKTIAGFYLFRDKIKGFTFYRNPPFTPHNGFVFVNSGTNPAKRLGKEKKVVRAMADKLAELARKNIVTVSLPQSLQDLQPFSWNDFKIVPQYTYIHDLERSEEELFDCFSPETRNSIRKAQKDGVEIDQSHDPELAKKIIVENLERKAAKIEKYWLDKIFSDFLTPENSFMTFTQKREQTLGVAVCVFDQQAAYYILGGVDQKIENIGAGPLGIWSSMLRAKSLGLKIFDFEGSMIPEVERFFRSFGPQQKTYFSVNKASFWKEVLLKKGRRSKF
ncbi:peptidoglycan bridge formation glycyltransferase FemA/FemB family protein [Halocola ammonii]